MNFLYYLVLAYLSVCYPCVQGRLPTRYSPVRRSLPKKIARLACVRHAASVHPEPGSNSQIKVVPAQTNHYLNIWLGLFVVSIDLKIVYVNLLFNFQSSYLLISASLFYQSCFSLSTLFLEVFSEFVLLVCPCLKDK